jgi:hypothetical protein
MSTRYNHGSHYENHQRAAELHDQAAHAHRAAAEHRGKQDHQMGQEHTYGTVVAPLHGTNLPQVILPESLSLARVRKPGPRYPHARIYARRARSLPGGGPAVCTDRLAGSARGLALTTL